MPYVPESTITNIKNHSLKFYKEYTKILSEHIVSLYPHCPGMGGLHSIQPKLDKFFVNAEKKALEMSK